MPRAETVEVEEEEEERRKNKGKRRARWKREAASWLWQTCGILLAVSSIHGKQGQNRHRCGGRTETWTVLVRAPVTAKSRAWTAEERKASVVSN